MKHLLVFEKYKHSKDAYWIIYDLKHIKKILSLFTYDGKSTQGSHEKIYSSLKKHIKARNISCVFLGYYNREFDFWVVEDDEDFAEAKEEYNNDGYKFKGEIKLVDGEIFVDDLMVNVEKYNL